MNRRNKSQSGSTILEFAIVAPLLVMMFFGTVGLGIMMGRYIQTVQVNRDIAHMYSDGVDFTQTTPQAIAVQLASGTGMTAAGGNGVIIFSQVQTVYAVDCTAAAISPCTNQGKPVFTQRLVLGNSALRSSQFGTPASSILDAKGNIASSVYLSNSNSTVLTTGFNTALTAAITAAGGTAPGSAPSCGAVGASSPCAQNQANIAYIVEVYFPYPDIGFLGYAGGGGAYSYFIFN